MTSRKVRERVARGFYALEQYAPGWRDRLRVEYANSPYNIIHAGAIAIIGGGATRNERQKVMDELVGKVCDGRSPVDVGLQGEGFWSDPMPEWRRMMKRAASGRHLKDGPPRGRVVDCMFCGDPRHDDITVRWVEGLPYCNPEHVPL